MLTQYLTNKRSNRAIAHLSILIPRNQGHLQASSILNKGSREHVYLSLEAAAYFNRYNFLSRLREDCHGRDFLRIKPLNKFVPVDDTPPQFQPANLLGIKLMHTLMWTIDQADAFDLEFSSFKSPAWPNLSWKEKGIMFCWLHCVVGPL